MTAPAQTSPAQLLQTARDLLRRADPKTAGLWPRAAALLARQALEAALDDFWRAKGVSLADCTTRAQLICLRGYLKDDDVAGQAQELWGALSNVCHHHAYELAPTVGELEGWLASARGMVVAFASGHGQGRSR